MKPGGLVNSSILAGLMFILAAAFILCPANKPVSVGQTVPAKPARETARSPTVKMPAPKTVMMYPNEVKRRLKLPESVVSRPEVQVAAASRIESDNHPHTITTVLDTQSGRFETFDRRDPLPWLARDASGFAGVAYGLKNGLPGGRIFINQNLIMVKSIGISGRAELDTDGDWFAGLAVAYRW